ncbi:hypothetical protein PWG14_20740 (plasmid) [Chromobacterium amazonense]|uniref:hypothetical protein n=1 Tax=Chromobacterium amazonense TaxID=1382803 RepID=UPI00237E2E82|nr:hypothetical protein [Chromobacterium amazonense]MDE1714919.1 hypothetical protein [Chromobacterium amazonense]
MRKIVLPAIAALFLMTSHNAMAGYLDFSSNWDAPSTKPMSKKAASNVVMQCSAVKAYYSMAGQTSGAMVVAGPHETPTDKNTHLTVRLYKNNKHEKSCHVYVNTKLEYTSCSCEYVD